MSQPTVDNCTDAAWEEWGRREPYFSVITHPKFRRREMTESDKREFFESGQWHVNYVMKNIKDHIDPDFTPRAILDFGCGVGRTLVGFAQIAEEAVGLDVSASMLKEARSNCDDRGLSNVRLVTSDDSLSALTVPFDLIHSFIVFQHIPVERGKVLFRRLLTLLAPRGIGAFQFLYSKSLYADNYGIAPPTKSVRGKKLKSQTTDDDPEMQMNPYNMNEIAFLLQNAGVRHYYADFSDHGGELGLFVFFRKT